VLRVEAHYVYSFMPARVLVKFSLVWQMF